MRRILDRVFVQDRFFARTLPYSVLLILWKLNKKRGLRLIDLRKVFTIREKPIGYLSDPALIETELLPELGLNNENLSEFPEELYKYCGYGLFSWQYPNQFSRYLSLLAQWPIASYLEIGARHGGTFIITTEYLRRFHPVERAYGIDIQNSPSLVRYRRYNCNADFINIDSRSPQFAGFLKRQPPFDLVFIDGDHSESGCRNDFQTMKDHANIIAFHDIVSDICPGACKVWNDLKASCGNEYRFFEFRDQYDSVLKRTGKQMLGIGVAVKVSFLEKKGISDE
jgi:hypothetical protein